jgi:hypothetical protein
MLLRTQWEDAVKELKSVDDLMEAMYSKCTRQKTEYETLPTSTKRKILNNLIDSTNQQIRLNVAMRDTILKMGVQKGYIESCEYEIQEKSNRRQR